MKYARDYPKGALKTLEEVHALLDGVVYHVHGIGSRGSSLSERHLRDGGTYPHKSVDSVFCYYREYSQYVLKDILREFSLRDCNIPANQYSDNFLFANKEDAENYLVWAREHTKPIELPRWIRGTWL
jgi:hypothetical protein